MKTKRCSKCNKRKLLNANHFAPDKRYNNGYLCWCRTCTNAYGKLWRRTPRGIASIKKGQKKHKTSKKHKQTTDRYQHSLNGFLKMRFTGLKSRCSDTNNEYYHSYGGRGIKLCFDSFDSFYYHIVVDLGFTHAKLHSGLQIGRININGNYKKGNIQIVTHTQVQQNSRKVQTHCGQATSSKYKGVCWHRKKQRWYAGITVNKKRYHLGSFVSEIDAAKAYDAASRKYHGKHGCSNADLGLL